MGHRKIGYLKSSTRISSFKERHQGYVNALAHFGLSFAPEHIWEVHYTEEGSYRDIRNYLNETSPLSLPDAFVCDDDTMAVGALRAFQEHGLQVPGDLSVIGFNDRPTCEVTIPPLTSINVSKRALAVEAVDELLRLIDGAETITPETRSRKIRIGTKLSVRESVGEKKCGS